jgi:hypothetical protein
VQGQKSHTILGSAEALVRGEKKKELKCTAVLQTECKVSHHQSDKNGFGGILALVGNNRAILNLDSWTS